MLVSAAAFETSAPRQVVDAVLDRVVEAIVSIDLMSEARRVFSDPRIVRFHGRRPGAADELLSQLEQCYTLVAPDGSPLRAPDPGDQHLWDLLGAVPDAILVTGDRRLLESADYPDRVLSPRQFVDTYLASS